MRPPGHWRPPLTPPEPKPPRAIVPCRSLPRSRYHRPATLKCGAGSGYGAGAAPDGRCVAELGFATFGSPVRKPGFATFGTTSLCAETRLRLFRRMAIGVFDSG